MPPLAGPYADFSVIGGAALDMTAAARRVTLSSHDRERILAGMRSLPPHADVRPGLERLRNAGFRVVTLTNSNESMIHDQLKNSGIANFFERAFSVDTVRRFKPAPEAYRHVATELGVNIAGLRMVAAHAWDVVGAMQAGCAAAFVMRPGKVLYPLAPTPDIVAADVRSVAEHIVLVDGGLG